MTIIDALILAFLSQYNKLKLKKWWIDIHRNCFVAQGSRALLFGWRKMKTGNMPAFSSKALPCNPAPIFFTINTVWQVQPDDCMEAHGWIGVTANQHGSDRKCMNTLNHYLFVTSLQHGSIPFLSVVINQFSSLSNKCFLQFKNAFFQYNHFQ